MSRGKSDLAREGKMASVPKPQTSGPEETNLLHDSGDVNVVPKAPDGGYGWVIVAASFFCNFIVDGIAYSGSQYVMAWKAEFPDADESTISLIPSLLNGVYLLMGPISSALTNAFGFRVIILSGAIIACVAFIITMFANSILYLNLSFGVLGGIGFGLIYTPAILCVCYYFDKKRAMAVGICVCGSGVGAFTFPPLTQTVMDRFGWQGSMLFLAGFILQVCVAGSSMLTLVVDVVDVVKTITIDQPGTPKQRSGILKVPPGGQSDRGKDASGVSAYRVDVVKSRKYSAEHGLVIQTVEGGRVQHESHSGVYNQVLSTADLKDASAVAGVQSHKEVAAPLDRKDVHVHGSLKHLDQEEKADADLQKFHSNNLRRDELQGTSITTPKKRRLSPQLRQALKDMIDLRIYGNVVFAVFSIGSFLAMIAFYIPFLFVPDHAVKEFQIEKDTAAWLISGIGLANIFGRLFWGWLADRPRMDPLVIHNCCILIVGIVLVFIPLCQDYISLMVVCAIFGFFVSPYISLMSIILTRRIPLDQLPSAFGQSQLVRGVAAMIGPPIGGALYAKTGDYSVTFFASGAAFVGAFCIFCVIFTLRPIRRE
ncbi:hypothetical protein RvY_01098 [Ramazzottius varieornatus]|uniref:Major facilitator superfamily (MFS) profile domain-containing protein n=1 Tax=Ramazzottius varieornatus TaxID=947166 RepID=A0A1D1UF41_RAMVA|nr:hypothetical protein RvY_01098 [Ramazzottius varieornatus]